MVNCLLNYYQPISFRPCGLEWSSFLQVTEIEFIFSTSPTTTSEVEGGGGGGSADDDMMTLPVTLGVCLSVVELTPPRPFHLIPRPQRHPTERRIGRRDGL